MTKEEIKKKEQELKRREEELNVHWLLLFEAIKELEKTTVCLNKQLNKLVIIENELNDNEELS